MGGVVALSNAVAESSVVAEPGLEARFEKLVAHHRDRPVRPARRLLGRDGTVAEDVTRDALVSTCRGLRRVRRDARLDVWIAMHCDACIYLRA